MSVVEVVAVAVAVVDDTVVNEVVVTVVVVVLREVVVVDDTVVDDVVVTVVVVVLREVVVVDDTVTVVVEVVAVPVVVVIVMIAGNLVVDLLVVRFVGLAVVVSSSPSSSLDLNLRNRIASPFKFDRTASFKLFGTGSSSMVMSLNLSESIPTKLCALASGLKWPDVDVHTNNADCCAEYTITPA